MATTTTHTAVTASGPASPIRTTLEATVPRMTAALRAAPSGIAPIPGMSWRVGELGAHIAQTAATFLQVLDGEPTAYGHHGEFSALVDQQLVDELRERDPARLAQLTEERYAAMRRAMAGRPDHEVLPGFQDYSVAALNAVWVLDLNVHGYQVGHATGHPFAVDNAGLRLALETVLPFAADPAGSRELRATYAMHITGTPPLVYSVDDGAIRVEPDGARVDCHVGIDPIAFLLVTLGVMPQWRAVLTLKLRAWGRKPWLAGRISRIFPPVPHGGVDR